MEAGEAEIGCIINVSKRYGGDMKRTLLFALISAALYSSVSFAGSGAFEHCKGHAEMAMDIMTKRQDGQSMITMMSAAALMGEFRKGAEQLIRMAYDEPRMHSPAGRDRQITEFSNKILSACLDLKDSR